MPSRTLSSTDEATRPTTGVLREPLTCANWLREEPVLRGGQRHAALDQDPAVERAEGRDHRDGGDDLAGRHAEDRGAEDACAASANGAFEFASVARGMTPMIATVAITYRPSSASVPRIVARGSVRSRILDLLGRHRGRLEAQERPQRQRGGERDRVPVADERDVVRVERREVAAVACRRARSRRSAAAART